MDVATDIDETLDLDEYQVLARQFAPPLGELTGAFLGTWVSEEVSEVVGVVRKYLVHKDVIDRAKLLEEGGDVLWALVNVAGTAGVDFAAVRDRAVDRARKINHPDRVRRGLLRCMALQYEASLLTHSVFVAASFEDELSYAVTQAYAAAVYAALVALLREYNATPEQCAAANRRKLRRRFQSGRWTVQESAARRDVGATS